MDLYILEPIGNPIGRMIFKRKSVTGPLKERLKGEGEALNKPLSYNDAITKSNYLLTKYGLRTRVVSLKEKIERRKLKSKNRRFYVKFKNPLEAYEKGFYKTGKK